MATKFLIVRDLGNGERETHPDTDPMGYPFATSASIECITRNLDGRWYVAPVEGDAQPVRLGGIQ